MKKILAICVLISSVYLASGQGYNRPESIVYDTAHSRYLISNYGNGSNGSILAYDPIEDVYSNFNTSQSVGPKGLVIYNNNLYVSENGFINGFNLDTGQRIFNKQVGSFYINDLTVDDQGNLFTGETNTGKIYKVNTITGLVEEWITGGLENLNGLLVDQENNRLLVVFYKSFAPILAIDLVSKEITTLVETQYHNCDGITVDNCGMFYISSQGTNVVFRFGPDFSKPAVEVVNGLTTPADIYYNRELDVLCIPEIDNNQVVFVDYFNTCQSIDLIQPQDNEKDIPIQNTNFSWEPVPKADYYRFELAEDIEFKKILIVDGTGSPEFLIESLDPNTTFFWRVNAYHGNQHTEYSSIRSFETESSNHVQLEDRHQEIKLFPNPTEDAVYIYWGNKIPERLQLLNSIGQKVLEFDAFDLTEGSGQNINLDNIPGGCYNCVVRMQDDSLWIKKLIVY